MLKDGAMRETDMELTSTKTRWITEAGARGRPRFAT